ncbi:MAG TPA: CDP-alcohol phosphatidyltransferase family protein [Actinomycetota bacterium]|nr:CDP-alcohol phosphatidyltransferase family protein [Actinomycetota bacterium]
MPREGERSAAAAVALARTADGLTFSRLVIAIVLVPVLGAHHAAAAAVLVGAGWLTDFFDGRAARAADGRTRLGAFDLWVDTLVGAGLLLGFVAWGWVPALVGVSLVVVLFAAFAFTRNDALSFLLQAIGYALLLWRTWQDGAHGALVWLLGLIVFLAVVNRKQFLGNAVPTFLNGIAEAIRGKPPAR